MKENERNKHPYLLLTPQARGGVKTNKEQHGVLFFFNPPGRLGGVKKKRQSYCFNPFLFYPCHRAAADNRMGGGYRQACERVCARV